MKKLGVARRATVHAVGVRWIDLVVNGMRIGRRGRLQGGIRYISRCINIAVVTPTSETPGIKINN